MSQLFGILYRIRHFFIFLFLQIICFYLIGKNSIYWEVTTFNSTNSFVAKTLKWNQSIFEFINLDDINDQLIEENKILRSELSKKNELSALAGTGYKIDSTQVDRFGYVVAKVIKNSQNLTDNYITIDKGTKDGIRQGMGVICPQGVVGQVMLCNDHYARISTILHSKFSVSAQILNKKLKKENVSALGICKWPGGNPTSVDLTTVDRFKSVFKGDTVVTSMQNAVFPPNVMIGRISRVQVNQTEAFYDLNVRLSTDFGSLLYVYVVDNKQINKQSSVEEPEPEVK